MKATVLHIIESLVVGGAEMLFIETLKGFSDEYRHVMVYMRPPTDLLPEVKADKVYYLNYTGNYSLLSCAYRLRKIIRKENIRLIHAHHYWPTIVARLAKPGQVKLITTVHSPLSQDAFKPNRLSLYLEQLTYRKSHHMIFVSEAVARDYRNYIETGAACSVLYNFVKDEFYLPQHSKEGVTIDECFKLVAVGSLRAAKNFTYLLKAFELLRKENIHLAIVGTGPLCTKLQRILAEKDIRNVTLLGSHGHVYEVLKQYDAFILSSVYEGMSLAVIEAMVVGLPCILSDIAPNREVTSDNALFFDLNSPEDCANKILELKHNTTLRAKLQAVGKQRSKEFQKQVYLHKLEALYKQYLP